TSRTRTVRATKLRYAPEVVSVAMGAGGCSLGGLLSSTGAPPYLEQGVVCVPPPFHGGFRHGLPRARRRRGGALFCPDRRAPRRGHARHQTEPRGHRDALGSRRSLGGAFSGRLLRAPRRGHAGGGGRPLP